MLNDELRVNSGLTYGASSRVQEDRLTGAITIGTFTKTESTERAVDITLGLLKKLAEKGLDEAQLKSAKAYVKGTFAVERLETSDQLVETLGDIELFGLNRGEVDDYFSRIDAVTVAKANEVARKYYRGDGLVFTLLGNAAKIREAVKKYGVVTEVAITKPGYPVQ
jgi:predicted Zn-dependent peptidase